MQNTFNKSLQEKFPYLLRKKLLLAVSGGVDSVVLAHLCQRLKLDIFIAHCNFNLRGKESDADEVFVAKLAKKWEVPFFSENFNTKTYAQEHRISTQMAARQLRYAWFEALRIENKLDFILTAHHANDNLETFLINLLRGTGPEGLSGINAEIGHIRRPLLAFSRQEIEAYARQNKIEWREDASNASHKYLRNAIRHDIVPKLFNLNPRLLGGLEKTQAHLSENIALVEDYLSLLYPKIVSKTKLGYHLEIAVLKQLPHPKAVLFQLLKSFGFTEWNDVLQLVDAHAGKQVFSPTHRLVKDRTHLILTKLPSGKTSTYTIKKPEPRVDLPMGTFKFSEVKTMKEFSENSIYVSLKKISFPLELRKWEEGDFFYPFGMQGKKKISRYFKDKKLSLPEKENAWLLCSGGKIVWVVGYRADARFAINQQDKDLLKISYIS